MKRRLTLLFFLIVAIACTLPFLAYASPHKYIPAHEQVFIKQGETLWNIAVREYGESADPWIIIDAIKAANGIEDPGNLRVGTSLLLPTIK